MNHISMSGLLKEIGLMAIVLAVIVLITVACSVKRKHETANTFKFRTAALIILGLFLSQQGMLWIVTVPVYLLLAWCSYKAGRVVASPPAADVVNIGKPALGVFDKFIIFNIILDYWPLPIMRIIKDESELGVLGKLIKFNIGLDYWPVPIFDIFSRLNSTNKSKMAGGVQNNFLLVAIGNEKSG